MTQGATGVRERIRYENLSFGGALEGHSLPWKVPKFRSSTVSLSGVSCVEVAVSSIWNSNM
jgi:hypothetical protein